MKRFKVPFLKRQFVGGYRVYEGETKEEALAKAEAHLLDGLQTTDVTWGEPEYEDGSFDIEVGTEDLAFFVEEVTEPEFMLNHRKRYDVPVGTPFPLSILIPGSGQVIKAVADDRYPSERCLECAASGACVCHRLECNRDWRQDDTTVRFVFVEKEEPLADPY